MVVATDSLQVIVQSYLDTVLLLHGETFAKPKLGILEGLLSDLFVLWLYLLDDKLAVFQLIRLDVLFFFVFNHFESDDSCGPFPFADWRVRFPQMVLTYRFLMAVIVHVGRIRCLWSIIRNEDVRREFPLLVRGLVGHWWERAQERQSVLCLSLTSLGMARVMMDIWSCISGILIDTTADLALIL